MRYTEDFPLIKPVAETDVPGPLFAVQPPRRVEPRTMAPLVIQRFRRKARNAEAANEENPEPQTEQRIRPDRREMCRRFQRVQAFLDTRSRIDRRKKVRREGDVATNLDEEG